MMKRIAKVKRIFEAFTQEPDLEGEVVAKRRAICDSCPFNSKNKASDELTFMQRVQHETGDFCTVCSCYIQKKTARSGETCGLEEIGEKPKWVRLNLRTVDASDLDILNESPELCNVKLNNHGTSFEIELLDTSKKQHEITLSVPKEQFAILSKVEGCQCVDVEIVDEYKLKISFDSTKLTTPYEKYFDVYFRVNQTGVEKNVNFAVVGK